MVYSETTMKGKTMNIYKGLTLVFAAATVGMAGYALNLEGQLKEHAKAHLRTSKALNYTAKLIAKHDVPIDEFDVIAVKSLMNK